MQVKKNRNNIENKKETRGGKREGAKRPNL